MSSARQVDELVLTEARKAELARALYQAPLVDAHGRMLEVRIARSEPRATRSQRGLFLLLCHDLAQQVVLDRRRGEYCHIEDLPPLGEYDMGPRFISKDEYRWMFSGVILGSEALPAPDSQGVVYVLRSSREMTRKQYGEAIDLARAFGDLRGVIWTPPKEVPTQGESE